ncbi:hypothetical protein BGX31_009328 [Mortierella sp. GBA43]|nr:hypothetical protein BGX31_009328 [Mortierella sp. GBA43]
MSPYSQRQPVASMTQTTFNHAGYNMVNNAMGLAGCGTDILGNTASHGSGVDYLNGLPANMHTSHDIIALANARKEDVLSVPRGAFHGTEPMSLDGLSAGIMSSAKVNKSSNGSEHNGIYMDTSRSDHHHTNEWSRVPIYPLSSSSPATTTSPNNSNGPLLFATSSCPNSMPVFTPSASISPSTPVVLSTVTGSSSSMDYMITNHKYLLVQQQQQRTQHPHHQEGLQQQHQHQHQHQQQSPTTAANSSGGYAHHPPPPVYVALPHNEYQGTYAQYSPFNLEVVAPSNGNHQNAIPMDSTPTGVAWTNNVGSASIMHMQSAAPAASASTSRDIRFDDARTQRQDPMQRSRQARSNQLQITTSLEPNIGSMHAQHASGGHSVVTSPSMAAANNGFQSSSMACGGPPTAQSYPSWGLATSPVESSFTSGSSTPSFASSSPSLSNSNFDQGGTSCNSSRPTSPLFGQYQFEGYVSERRARRQESELSPTTCQIIRSRKSSTSSTSSNTSQRRMSTIREMTSTITTGPTTPSSPSMSPPLPQTPTSSGSPSHQCPKCGQYFAGPAVLLRHIESIHDKLLWNCGGCKSNLSRRDAVTRHINLSPMDSICRQVGTIGQIKMINGTEIHYEISSYRAKPLEEVMSRMGKKTPSMKKENEQRALDESELKPTIVFSGEFTFEGLGRIGPLDDMEDSKASIELIMDGSYEDEDGQQKKRRRPSHSSLVRRRR